MSEKSIDQRNKEAKIILFSVILYAVFWFAGFFVAAIFDVVVLIIYYFLQPKKKDKLSNEL